MRICMLIKSFLFLSNNVSLLRYDYLSNKLKYRNLDRVILLVENREKYHSCIMFSNQIYPLFDDPRRIIEDMLTMEELP